MRVESGTIPTLSRANTTVVETTSSTRRQLPADRWIRWSPEPGSKRFGRGGGAVRNSLRSAQRLGFEIKSLRAERQDP